MNATDGWCEKYKGHTNKDGYRARFCNQLMNPYLDLVHQVMQHSEDSKCFEVNNNAKTVHHNNNIRITYYYYHYLFFYRAVVKELVETEQEFVRDLDYVIQKYLLSSEVSKAPKIVKDNIEAVFGNLKQIADFHNS